MKLRTELSPPIISPTLEANESVLVLGSCFAENIGKRLKRGGVEASVNPLGIQYNPLSISRILAYISGMIDFDEGEVFERLGLYRHWDVHTRLCASTRELTIKQISTAIAEGVEFIKNARWLYLTLGSAHVWMRGERPVGNCHKMPNALFSRHLLSVDQCALALTEHLTHLRHLNPDLHVMITVSPVRYQRDGLVDSQRSKATLLLAAHQVCDQLEGVHYFPAYELLIDDLRDYRFYARDLVHPSELAVDYIWDHFQRCAISTSLLERINANERAARRAQHRDLTQG